MMLKFLMQMLKLHRDEMKYHKNILFVYFLRHMQDTIGFMYEFDCGM